MNRSLRLKRLFDICFSAGALLFGMPIFIIIGIAIKLDSAGPIIFVQPRNGLRQKVFHIYKFRTMSVHEEPEGRITQASRSDPRVTRVGRFLRSTSLDELPQFINVLKGDMSVIGPRPHAVKHNLEYAEKIPYYNKRHLVKPGISGLAQVNGHRGETDTLEKMERRVADDILYSDTWTLIGDIKLIVRTLISSHSNKDVY